ncbi:MAG: hypothetical protein WBX19_14215 [Terracidiphilus sp.]|jgi:hypothetical protein
MPRATLNAVFALAATRGFASVLWAVASLVAEVGLVTLAVDFEVDLEAPELLIKDFFVIAIVISPRKMDFRIAYANLHCMLCAKSRDGLVYSCKSLMQIWF